MRFFSIYYDFIKIELKTVVEYPVAFWSHTIAKMLGWGADLTVIYLMILQFENVLNWSAYEVLFLCSLNAASYAMAGFFMFAGFNNLQNHIQSGEFDEILTKPINSFFYLISKNFSYGYLGNLISVLIALVICIIKLNITMSLFDTIYLLLVLLGGMLIYGALFMFTSIPSFWIVKVDALTRLRGQIGSFLRYPISIYDKCIQILLTFIFPLAFINFYPAQYFLNKNDLLGFSPIFPYLTPIVGVVVFLLGYLFFFEGIKNYSSTGS